MASAEALTTEEGGAALNGRSDSRPPSGWLRRWRWPVMIGGPLLILGIVAYFLVTAGRTQSTDDAYVEAARVPISASIGGRVIELGVRENQPVQAGQVLFRLDVRDQSATLEQNEAQLAAAKLQVEALRAAYDQQRTNLKTAQDTAAYDDREVARQKGLLDAGVASLDQYEAALHNADLARQQIAASQSAGGPGPRQSRRAGRNPGQPPARCCRPRRRPTGRGSTSPTASSSRPRTGW